MRQILTSLVLSISLLFGTVGIGSGQDFQKGASAFERGDYATALREWRPLAEQGNASAQAMLGYLYGE